MLIYNSRFFQFKHIQYDTSISKHYAAYNRPIVLTKIVNNAC